LHWATLQSYTYGTDKEICNQAVQEVLMLAKHADKFQQLNKDSFTTNPNKIPE
jgi:hypothetical protein